MVSPHQRRPRQHPLEVLRRKWRLREHRQKIQLETLDRIQEVAGVRVDVIKVDIEGHEHKFLTGARATLERNRPAILMEANRPHYKRQGLDFDALIPTLLPRDYVPAIRYDADVLFVPRERR